MAADRGRVRPYVATRGRTRPEQEIALESLVSTTSRAGEVGYDPEPERARILRICTEPRSVAEVAALIGTPLGVARVLVADLEAEGLVQVSDSRAGGREPAQDRSILQRVRDGLRDL